MRRTLRLWSALVCAFLALSMTLSDTLAWKSLSQTARNDVRLERRPDDLDDDDDEVTISGEKRWDYGDRPREEWPQSVVVYIYADGKLVCQQLIDAESAWKYSAKLPKYDSKTGKKIAYTVGEEPVPGYELTVEGFDLVNTYIGEGPAPTPGESEVPEPTPSAPVPSTPTPEGSEPPAVIEPVPTPPPGVPKTGDTNELWIWLGVTVFGALGLLACLARLVWRKRRYTGKRLMKK